MIKSVAVVLAMLAASAAGTMCAQGGGLSGAPAAQFPFGSWSYAKAYTYNFFDDRPVQMRVVTRDGTWSRHIRSEQRMSAEQAQQAADLVARTQGSVELTRCTFPRHAIVYFDATDKPIASIDVCFSCEAVLVWPDYKRPDDFDHEASASALDRALPAWRRLFEGSLNLPVDYRAAANGAAQKPEH